MGLDTVELIIAIEEAFGITFSAEDGADCRTPGHLIDAILRKTGAESGRRTCLTQRAFHRVRTAMQQVLALPRKSVRPATVLCERIPLHGRRMRWAQIGRNVGLTAWPRLVRPRWLVAGLTGLVLVSTVGLWIAVQRHLVRVPLPPGMASIAAGCLAGFGGAFCTRPFRRVFPVRTVGELARKLAVRNPGELKHVSESFTREEVSIIVAGILDDVLGIRKFNEDDDFVRDLGLD